VNFIHILRDRAWYSTPPWAAHERLTGLAAHEIVHPECCYRRMRADECVAVCRFQPDCPEHGARHYHIKFLKAHPPWDADREHRLWCASYYDPDYRLFCGPGMGCNADPKRRRGAGGRRWMLEPV
jgi:hypothetical protein